jgi:hypothetical protein
MVLTDEFLRAGLRAPIRLAAIRHRPTFSNAGKPQPAH